MFFTLLNVILLLHACLCGIFKYYYVINMLLKSDLHRPVNCQNLPLCLISLLSLYIAICLSV